MHFKTSQILLLIKSFLFFDSLTSHLKALVSKTFFIKPIVKYQKIKNPGFHHNKDYQTLTEIVLDS